MARIFSKNYQLLDMSPRSEHSDADNTLLKLVSELTLEERTNFLEKLKGHSTMSFDALYEEDNETESGEVSDDQYARLPWYYRLAYFILSFFKSMPASKVYEDSKVSKLARKIEDESPGLYHYQRNVLLPEFYQYLSNLKESARFFFSVLDASVNRDKGAFYAFLGSLEMNEVHQSLLSDAAPEKILEQNPTASESEMRQAGLRVMENAFAQINANHRNIMYFNARSLNCLKELSSFLFDRILLAFGADGRGQTCSVNMVREMLSGLANILFSLKDPPTLSLLESLFIFKLQERRKENGFNIDRELRDQLSSAEEAIETIRTFNQVVPLAKIIRCAGRDLRFAPRQISGGEDWFQVYREYWKQHIENTIIDFSRKRKQREVFNSFRHFLKGTNLKVLENAVSDSNPHGLPLPEAFTLAFLQTFHAAVFMEDINTWLSPILLEGEFIKRENRTEFTGAYNDIMKIADDIKKFDSNISPGGDYGKRYNQAKDEISSLPVKRRKIQIVMGEASGIASQIITRTRDSIRSVINVLSGILNNEPGSKYDKLINMEKLAGKNIEGLRKGIADSINLFNQALQILKDIEAMGNLW